MINASELKEKIASRGYTEAKIAEKLEIDKHAFYEKVNGIGKCFTIKEVDRLVQILRLEGSDAERIFFAN